MYMFTYIHITHTHTHTHTHTRMLKHRGMFLWVAVFHCYLLNPKPQSLNPVSSLTLDPKP
jgi:hypothetical protein